MKQLEKLVAKKVITPETVKGGKMAFNPEFSIDGPEKTTENHATWNGQHYVTDTRQDPNQ